MAGGKETPRQKMIGMMYLVLTALLALNVSKEIINAFVKLNDKIEDGNHIVDSKSAEALNRFEAMMAVPQTKASTKPWKDRADQIHKLSYDAQMYLLNETNDLLKEVDGPDVKFLRDSSVKMPDGKPWKYLSSLMEVQGKDKYDEGTRLFVGGDPTNVNERGQKLRTTLEKVRDDMCTVMAGYTEGKKTYKFNAAAAKGYNPDDKATFKKLDDAVKDCNPADQQRIKQVYRTLSYPLKAKEHGEETSWQGSMFDHAPSVAACAMFTTLRGDVKTAEAIALDHLTTKLEQPLIKINKIEPMAFARTGYLNVGDSMKLKVMIAAYDSTDVPIIKYDEGSGEKEIKGAIPINASSAGEKEIKGTIGVKQKGELVWKPWSFRYEVGQPMGVISAEDLKVLYVGYPNTIAASASGYPQEKVQLSTPGCTQKREGKNYIVIPPGTLTGKKIMLSVSAGGKQLGKNEFQVRNLPSPNVYFGNITSTQSTCKKQELLQAIATGRITARYDASIPLTKITFAISSFEVEVSIKGNSKKIPVSGANIGAAQAVLNQIGPGGSFVIKSIVCRSNTGAMVRVAPIACSVM
ncbi:MAG TPA: hypothetical protein VK177_05035 [Flavobacteriales bacterium]|nr:hypothetical protein [Flavobacteriales bacterium]